MSDQPVQPQAESVHVSAKHLIEKPDQYTLSEPNINNAIAIETARYLRAINNKLNFFVWLAILGIIFSLISLLSRL